MNPERNIEPDINNQEDENRPHYGVIIVLGNGFIKEVNPKTGEEKTVLSQDSRIRATASGILAQDLDVPEVIYSGGKTAGPDYPSEAAAMYEYAKLLYPDLEKRKVVLEEKSWDTSTNAEYVGEIMDENQISGPAILISSAYHNERADYHFLRHGIDATPMSAEAVTATRSLHHERYIREKLASQGNLKAEIIESILKSMLIIDPEGEIPKKMAEKRLE